MEQYFQRVKAESKEDYLKAAWKGEAYVQSFLKENPDGIYMENDGTIDNTWYSGSAGILHMYIQLHRITGEEAFLDKIRKITKYLSLHWDSLIKDAAKKGALAAQMAEAFYSGIGGIGLILTEVYRLYRDEYAENGRNQILQYYKNTVKTTTDGYYWSDNAPVFFDAGIGLFLIDAYNTSNDAELIPLITGAANHILNEGIRHENGGIEFNHLSIAFKQKEPNFEFGTAGIGYFFLKVYELTADIRYLEAAKAAADYMESIAVRQKKGILIPYKLTQEKAFDGIFYLGNCHGPVGTIKLFLELYRKTKEKRYFHIIYELCDGMEALGAPYRQSAGYWNTTCLCCGPAGFVPLYTGLYYETGEERWKKLAIDVGEILLGTGTDDKETNRMKWELAFDRIAPEKITAPAGYFTGAAGIVTALLLLYTLEQSTDGITGLIDDAYLKHAVR